MEFENYLLESFAIGSKPIRVAKYNRVNILTEHFEPTLKDISRSTAENMIASYEELDLFIYNGYIIFFLKERELKYHEIHFNIKGKSQEFANINNSTAPMSLLTHIFNVVYWYGLDKGCNIKIDFGDRLSIYSKIIKRLLVNHSKYEYIQNDYSILLNYKHTSFTERFIPKG